MLHTLQDISLACCTGMCCMGGVFFFMLYSAARAAGRGLFETAGGLFSGGGLLGLLSLGNLAELGLQFLGGGGNDDEPRYPGRKRQ
jgi:hypothetical protein